MNYKKDKVAGWEALGAAVLVRVLLDRGHSG